MSLDTNLLARAADQCELCSTAAALFQYDVPSSSTRHDASIAVCEGCAAELVDGAELSPKHWHCLQTAIWSEVPAVQVASYRLLERLRAEGWASELLESAYLEGDVLAWAKEGAAEVGVDERPVVKDTHGALLADGDSVTLVKDLDVKGAGFTAKRGTLVKGIRLTDDPRHVEGRVQGIAIVLKTEFLKKA
jgi:protein PhnA